MEKINWITTSTDSVDYVYFYNDNTVYDAPFEYTANCSNTNYVATYTYEV